MSEREVVHKEIEQLQDKLTDMNKLLDKYTKEKSATEGEIEHLKQELAASAASQEKYRQVSEEAMELRGQLEAERVEHERELQLMEQQRDIARKERHQALEQMDILIKETYEKTQKEKAEEMDQVSKETELLKKEIDKMRLELTGESWSGFLFQLPFGMCRLCLGIFVCKTSLMMILFWTVNIIF